MKKISSTPYVGVLTKYDVLREGEIRGIQVDDIYLITQIVNYPTTVILWMFVKAFNVD